jgi:hypothetical protein
MVSDYRATIERLFSDYRRANPAPKFFQTFQKLFKNPIRIFSKPFEKSSGFSAPRLRGCRGGAVSARGGSVGLEAAGSPQSGRDHVTGGDPGRWRRVAGLAAAELRPPRASWLPSAVIMRTACGRRGCGCRAADARLQWRAAVIALWGVYAPTMAF